MIKLIVGAKGSGKTKTLIDMIDQATKTSAGNIVVIEKSMKLTTEINHKARLLDVDEYDISGADMFYGFVAGVLAGNYDITELFIDGILKVVDHDMEQAGKVLPKSTRSPPTTWKWLLPFPPTWKICRKHQKVPVKGISGAGLMGHRSLFLVVVSGQKTISCAFLKI